jgi:hypothetical protein
VVKLSLTKRGEQVVSRTKAEMGITQIGMLERLLEWFAAQDPRIRTMILNPYPEVRRGLARLVLEDMQANPLKDYDTIPAGFNALVDHDFGSESAVAPTALRVRNRDAASNSRKSRS